MYFTHFFEGNTAFNFLWYTLITAGHIKLILWATLLWYSLYLICILFYHVRIPLFNFSIYLEFDFLWFSKYFAKEYEKNHDLAQSGFVLFFLKNTRQHVRTPLIYIISLYLVYSFVMMFEILFTNKLTNNNGLVQSGIARFFFENTIQHVPIPLIYIISYTWYIFLL